ncbi:MAG TPA: TlpA disulfide reductase family protein [Flavobacteriaceae bacterium]|nr:TlpA disulfide reductase family protein [Flavobacteriaceae bacterium]
MRRFFGIIMAFSLIACQGEKDSNEIGGTAKGVKDGTLVFVSTLGENNRPMPIDTATVTNESFTLNLPETQTQTFNILTLDGWRGNVLFIRDNEPISFEIYKDSLRSSVVSGGKHNELLDDYFDYIYDFGKRMNNLNNQMRDPANLPNSDEIADFKKKQEEIQQEYAEYGKEIVHDNPGSLVSIIAISDMLNMKAVPIPEIKKLYESLDPEIKNYPMGAAIGEQLQNASVTAVGSKAPEFSGPTPTGETVALKDVLGKVTLLDFWASWCKPCRVENPNIVRVYEKYHDKGLNIIGVSLDKSKDKWLQAIEADNLTWNHVSNLQFWQEPIAQMYQVRSIPAAFLLDENGVIIGKNLRGKALEDKVAEVLGE